MNDFAFEILKPRFAEHHKRLYLVGGTVRDLLLGRSYTDHDMVTDATPEEMKAIVPEASFTFAKYGSVRLKIQGEEVDITTLRKETGYTDRRHPSAVEFIQDPETDSLRRDFTINAMYMDENYRLLDFHQGKEDLENKILRFIGDPNVRIAEDPLRILRAERFGELLGFALSPETKEAIEAGRGLLSSLKKEKIEEEYRKLKRGKNL